jgi:hypothetical protein
VVFRCCCWCAAVVVLLLLLSRQLSLRGCSTHGDCISSLGDASCCMLGRRECREQQKMMGHSSTCVGLCAWWTAADDVQQLSNDAHLSPRSLVAAMQPTTQRDGVSGVWCGQPQLWTCRPPVRAARQCIPTPSAAPLSTPHHTHSSTPPFTIRHAQPRTRHTLARCAASPVLLLLARHCATQLGGRPHVPTHSWPARLTVVAVEPSRSTPAAALFLRCAAHADSSRKPPQPDRSPRSIAAADSRATMVQCSSWARALARAGACGGPEGLVRCLVCYSSQRQRLRLKWVRLVRALPGWWLSCIVAG